MLFYPLFRNIQRARLIMIFSFQSRADWKVFVDKFVFIVEFLCLIIYIKRVQGDHVEVRRQTRRGYKKYKLWQGDGREVAGGVNCQYCWREVASQT